MATLPPNVAVAASLGNVVTHAFIGLPISVFARHNRLMRFQFYETVVLFAFSVSSHFAQTLNIDRNMPVHIALQQSDMNFAQFAFPMAAMDFVKMPHSLRSDLQFSWLIVHSYIRVIDLEPLVSVYVSAAVFMLFGVLAVLGYVELRPTRMKFLSAAFVVLAAALTLYYLDSPIMVYETHSGWHITVWSAQWLYYLSMEPTLCAEEKALTSQDGV